MDHPDVDFQLERINDAIGIAALLDRQFPNASAQACQRFGNVGCSAISHDGQRIER